MRNAVRKLGFHASVAAVFAAVFLLDLILKGWFFKGFFVFLALLFILGLFLMLRKKWKLKTQGYYIAVSFGREAGEEHVYYHEAREANQCVHGFRFLRRRNEPSLLVIPCREGWDFVVPSWLGGRYDEIVARLKAGLSPSKFTLCDSETNAPLP
jgi:hypothetical protein